MKVDSRIWRGTDVFVTGHTGFKGGWLTLWLAEMGARVHGYALNPPTEPSLYRTARVAETLKADTRADLADLPALQSALKSANPRVVFHLAAQPLVRPSYQAPLATFSTNVIGTAHLLEAVRSVPGVEAVVIVTSDKVYHNREWVYPYRETDALGGWDPYSASKGAAEIVAASYRASFYSCVGGHGAQVATARAGNVIGGGDWAQDRLLPDCFRAFASGCPVSLRFPSAVRPWQHVLEPLSGYLTLAEALLGNAGRRFADAWNFGPKAESDATVGEVANAVARMWGNDAHVICPENVSHPHEAGLLRLDTTRSRSELGWKPRLDLGRALEMTVNWHKAWLAGLDMAALTREQIGEYDDACSH